MQLSDSGHMYDADSSAINESGVPSTLLMKNAAEHLAREAFGYTRPGGTAVCFCGSGNNGGDGVCAAYLLIRRGVGVRAFLVGRREKMTGDELEMERRLIELGGRLEMYDPLDREQESAAKAADVIIDAIFGIGLSREVKGTALSAIELINRSGAAVVSADIPSGVEADTGRILGAAVGADVTVTFSMAKPGHFVQPGCVSCGEVKVFPIGIPPETLKRARIPVFAVTDGDAALPEREPLTHKGDYGKVLIIAGKTGYTGAASMCASAAVKSGAGLVWVGVPESIYGITAVKCDEAMPFPLRADENGGISESAVSEVLSHLKNATVCAVGPGLGRGKGAAETVYELVRSSTVPLIIDADGLNALSENMGMLEKKQVDIIMTPHEGEFLRLGGTLTGDRISDARSFAEKHGVVLLLKGHRSIVAFPDGETHIIACGNPGMAKGGTGDVLTGCIAALVGQLGVRRGVIAGAFLHSLAGDMCRDELGEYGMGASDIVRMLPRAEIKMIKRE